jgi:hypothetical protein
MEVGEDSFEPPQLLLKVLSNRTVPARAIRQHGPWTDRPVR